VTATRALTNATLPYVARIADRGWKDALGADTALGRGLNAAAGRLTNKPVAQAFGMDHIAVAEAVAG
jgi:alanine dehydrogenase